MPVSGLRNRAVRFGYCGRGRFLGLPRLCFFLGGGCRSGAVVMPVLGRDSRRFQRGRGRGGVAGARFPVGSPVPGGRWKSPCRYGVESQLIENFLKKFLAKSLADCEKAVLLRSCSAGAGQGREGGRGGGSRGEKNFSKNFSEKVWRFEKKMYFCTPERKRG